MVICGIVGRVFIHSQSFLTPADHTKFVNVYGIILRVINVVDDRPQQIVHRIAGGVQRIIHKSHEETTDIAFIDDRSITDYYGGVEMVVFKVNRHPDRVARSAAELAYCNDIMIGTVYLSVRAESKND